MSEDLPADLSRKILEAAERLRGKGLLAAGDSLSLRIPGKGKMLILEIDEDGITPDRPAIADLTDYAGNAEHLWVYRQRPDVGAALINRQPWAAALAALPAPLPGVFDEQVRHLGQGVRQIGPDPSLAGGANAFLLGGRVLCLGIALQRTVCNAELLEKCAKAFILAHSSGLRVRRIPWLVRMVANRRLRRDQLFAAQCYARGEMPVLASGY